MTIEDMWARIVEDPIDSEKYNGEVRLDDFSRMYINGNYACTLRPKFDDDIVRELYYEWKRGQAFKEINGQDWFKNPRKFHM